MEKRYSSLRQPDPLTRYYRDLSRIPVLTEEQEKEIQQRLSEARARRDQLQQIIADPNSSPVEQEEARCDLPQVVAEFNAVVNEYMGYNLRLVLSFANKYARFRGIDLADLVQEGSFGLRRAIEKFEPEKGYKLSTYAGWWIRQAVFRGIVRNANMIYLPTYLQTILIRMKKRENALRAMNNSVDADDLRDTLELSHGEVDNLHELDLLQVPLSMDMPLLDSDGAGDRLSTFGETISERDGISPEDGAMVREMEELFQELFEQYLTPRERQIMQARLKEEATLHEVGVGLGLSRERVRQIQERASNKILRAMRSLDRQDKARGL